MKKTILLSILALSASLLFSQVTNTTEINKTDSTYQQESQKQAPVKKQKKAKSHQNKLFFGGSLGFSFGSYTSIRINPMVGYKLTPKLSTGFKFMYEHSEYHSSSYSSDDYGAGIFARYRIIPPIYIHAEYNYMNYQSHNDNGNGRYAVPYLFLGGGFVKRIGKRTYAYAEILFDVLNDSNSPYNEWNPFYSVGVSVGF